MQKYIIKHHYEDLKNDDLVQDFLIKETSCTICDNSLFKIERISAEHIMLICENCGEIHVLTSELYNEKLYLNFFCPEIKEEK